MAGFRYKAQDLSLGGVLINSLCHGACHEETPSPDDLMLVCKETPVVVVRFAAGTAGIDQRRYQIATDPSDRLSRSGVEV